MAKHIEYLIIERSINDHKVMTRVCYATTDKTLANKVLETYRKEGADVIPAITIQEGIN